MVSPPLRGKAPRPARSGRGVGGLLLLSLTLAAAVTSLAEDGGPARDQQGGLGRRLETPAPTPAHTAAPGLSRAAAGATAATHPATGPAMRPTTRGAAKREEDTKRVFDHLMKEYRAILGKSRDRLGRSLAIVCMARIPRADATAELLTLLKRERDPLVRMVCWQCLLARANGLSEAEYRQWADLTPPLVEANVFRGDLRVALLQFLALSPPDARAKDWFSRIFAATNSMDVQDYPTLLELGRTMKAWGDPAVAEAILARLTDVNSAQRAEVVLHAAGCGVPHASARRRLGSAEMWKLAQQAYAAWWKVEKPHWKARGKTQPGEWRKLEAQYVPRVEMAGAVDPGDRTWYRDLELRPPSLRTFCVGLVVDTTGSMGQVLVWLRADVKRMMEAFGFIALEPQITVTFYRDFGDQFVTRTVPLTGRADTLAAALQSMEARGGGDLPEAVREALLESLSASKWPATPRLPKALVLIGDAPPHPQTLPECEKIIQNAAGGNFRLYALKVRTGWGAEDLSSFDRLAAAGNGASRWVDMRAGRALEAVMEKRVLRPEGLRRLARVGSADTAADAPPGEWVVSQVLVDAINPQFADRVRPPAAILWQMLKDPTVERHQHFPPPPPRSKPRPRGPRPPFDPQRQR